MQAIRIMHVLDNLGRGGMQTGLVNLINRLDPARFEHVVCTMRHLDHPHAHRFSGNRVRIVSLGDKDKRSRIQLPAIARAIREMKPDIVHSRNWAAIEAVIAARLLGGKAVIHSEHGLDENPCEPRRRTLLRRLVFELADRVLCVSHQLRVVHSARTGFREDRMMVIHNGVDTTRFHADGDVRARVRQELGLSAGEVCIGSVANLTPVKDHMTLVQAASLFARTPRNWRMILIGDGPERERIQSFCKDRPELAGRVIFYGLTDRVSELLKAVDVYVLTSLTEGICNSLLEAMATSLPVVVTATGGNPEVVNHQQCGLLFPVGDFRSLAEHLEVLYIRPELREQIGRRALQRVNSHFSIDSMVEEYDRLYGSLAAKAGIGEYKTALGRLTRNERQT